MREMQDSTNAGAFTTDPNVAQLLAGYVDGEWPSFTMLAHTHTAQRHVSITATGRFSANVGDQERGDMTPESAAVWAKGEHSAGRHPTIYTSEGNWQECKDAVHAVGLDPDRDVSWWIAWWGHDGIPDGAVACQYAHDVNGVDLSHVRDYWPGVDPAPEPQDHTHTTTTTEAIVPNLPTLSHGATGLAVRRVQGLLVAAHKDIGTTGAHHDGIDGDFGPATEEAVKEVQRDNGIADDGVVGNDTYTALLSGRA